MENHTQTAYNMTREHCNLSIKDQKGFLVDMKPVSGQLNTQASVLGLPSSQRGQQSYVLVGARSQYPLRPSAYNVYAPYFPQSETTLSYTPQTPSQYYMDKTKDKFVESYIKGNNRFYRSLKDNPLKGALVLASSLGLGTLLSAFNRRIDMTLKLLLITGTMIFPIMHANNNFPKIEKAYDEYKAGNPKKADKMFSEALNDSVYTIFHAFLKPITLSVAWGAILSLPAVLKVKDPKQVRGMIETIAYKVLNLKPFKNLRTGIDKKMVQAGVPEAMRPTHQMSKFHGKLTRWGSEIEQNLDTNYPRLSRFIPNI